VEECAGVHSREECMRVGAREVREAAGGDSGAIQMGRGCPKMQHLRNFRSANGEGLMDEYW